MRNAVLAILVLLVLGLAASNVRLKDGHRRLQGRLAAAEAKTRTRPATPAEERPKVELPPPAPPIEATPVAVPAPPSSPPASRRQEEIHELTEPEVSVQRTSVHVYEYEPLTWIDTEFIEPDDLSEPQRALLDSFRRSRDAELQPFQSKVREIEDRYSKSMMNVLTPEQQSRRYDQRQTIRLGAAATYRSVLKATARRW